jgi:glycosyltransferase involved in cell wall biosynthesis
MAGAMRESWLRHTHTEVRAIPNPVALGAAAASTGGSTAVYVGRLSAEKGLALAVEASARSGVPLVIAGDGPERSNLEELSNRLDAPVSFVGFLSATELEAVWQQAAFKVMPSIWPENAPLAVLESMARGIPVIAADIGGLPELINSVAGGALVPPGDVNALADAMAAGAAGTINRPDPQAVISRFGWATHLEHVEDVYWGDSNVDSNGRSAERSRDPRRAGASSRGTLG